MSQAVYAPFEHEVESEEDRREESQELFSQEVNLSTWQDLMWEYDLEGHGAD